MLAPQGQYYNYSGCGNTFNCNHPQVRKFILDCLRYWVLEMHVDGFRFDLASIMTRAPSVWHRHANGAASSLHAGQHLEVPPATPSSNGGVAATAEQQWAEGESQLPCRAKSRASLAKQLG